MAKRVVFESEAQIAERAITELQRQGYETYQEVSTGYGGRRADIVGVRGPIIAVVECKASMSLQLLDQLCAWRGFAHYIIGAIPSGRHARCVEHFARDHGFGLWKIAFDEIAERPSPRLHRQAGTHWIRKALRPEQRTGEFAKAGTRGGGYWTPFRSTCRELASVVALRPGIELREALKVVNHHYASGKSAMSALPGLIRKGVVEGVRVDDSERHLRLFPALAQPGAADAVDPVDGIVTG